MRLSDYSWGKTNSKKRRPVPFMDAINPEIESGPKMTPGPVSVPDERGLSVIQKYMTPKNVNTPSMKKIAADPKKETKGFWEQPVVGNMSRGRFSEMTGMLAAAIAPDSAQGRAGAVLGRFAGKAADKAESEGREDALKEERWGREDMLDEKNWNRTTGRQDELFDRSIKNEDRVRGLEWGRQDDLREEDKPLRDLEIQAKQAQIKKWGAPERTSLQQDYEYAKKDGYTGSFMDFAGTKKGSSKDGGLSIKDETTITENIMSDAIESKGWRVEGGNVYDYEGNPVSFPEYQKVRKQAKTDASEISSLVKQGATIGEARQAVEYRGELRREKNIKSAVDKVMNSDNPKSVLQGLDPEIAEEVRARWTAEKQREQEQKKQKELESFNYQDIIDSTKNRSKEEISAITGRPIQRY